MVTLHIAVNHFVAIALWVFPWSQRGIEMKESGSGCLAEDAIWLVQGTVTLREGIKQRRSLI